MNHRLWIFVHCLIAMLAVIAFHDYGSVSRSKQAAINDNGCASHQVLVPMVERIDNYNIDSLRGE